MVKHVTCSKKHKLYYCFMHRYRTYIYRTFHQPKYFGFMQFYTNVILFTITALVAFQMKLLMPFLSKECFSKLVEFEYF